MSYGGFRGLGRLGGMNWAREGEYTNVLRRRSTWIRAPRHKSTLDSAALSF